MFTHVTNDLFSIFHHLEVLCRLSNWISTVGVAVLLQNFAVDYEVTATVYVISTVNQMINEFEMMTTKAPTADT